MAEDSTGMDRRKFLSKSALFMAASLLGMGVCSKAFAYGEQGARPFYPPLVALIIDDIGFSVLHARRFLKLGIPLTFSILPRLAHSDDLALEIRDKGHEVMLHQPMEPSDPNVDPGPGALYVKDRLGKISTVLEENMSFLPFASGVNNHMGSKFTACQKQISEALRVIKDRGLFFIDSVTTSRSKAYKSAKNLHMDTACRNIFLDNHLETSAILRQLIRLERHAERYGRAIGIGHPFPETAFTIGQFVRARKASGICFVHVSQVLRTCGC